MVNDLNFQTQLPVKKAKTNSADPNQTLIRVFPVCYSDNHFVNLNRKSKVFEILEHLL